MGRSPCCSKEGLNRGAWTAMEDKILTDYIQIHGEGKWRYLPKRAGLKRCGKSCRLRWLNYLRPDIKRGNITKDEEELIIRLHKLLGNRWSLIAGRLPGRTDNEIKNYWNTNISKKLKAQQNPSTTNGKPSKLNSYQVKHNHKANPSSTQKQDPNSRLIITKASRCTKVVIDTRVLLPPKCHDQIIKKAVEPEVDDMTAQESFRSKSNSKFIFEENNLLTDFLMDIEMDEQFLSELLNEEFSQLPCNHSEGDSGTTNTPNSGQTLVFHNNHALHECDFQSITSLIESELDWLS